MTGVLNDTQIEYLIYSMKSSINDKSEAHLEDLNYNVNNKINKLYDNQILFKIIKDSADDSNNSELEGEGEREGNDIENELKSKHILFIQI